MEQRNLPLAEDSPRLSSLYALSSETGQSVETLLYAADPTFEPDQVEVLGAALSRMAQRSQKCVGRAIWIPPVMCVVATVNALPVVQRMVHGEAKTTAKQRIQAEAQACLAALELRIEQAHNPHTLLRASSGFDASEETLLRAAKGGQETAPEQLLRPSAHTYER
jgi:hypothetical protein